MAPGKSIATSSVVLVLLVSAVFAQSTSPVFSDPKASGFFKPKMVVEGSTTHDFGNIYRGQKVSHLFTIKNEGSDTLVINNVSASCGCTAAMVSTHVIPPRGKSDLDVTFDSHSFSGQVVKIVTITSNDPETPSEQVTIKANIVSVFELSSSYIFIQQAKLDSASSTSIEMKNATDKTVRVLSVEPKLDGLRAEVTKKRLKPGESTTLKASFKPTREGLATGEVSIKTDFKPQPDLSIRFTANVRN